jgi:hypothetical protein
VPNKIRPSIGRALEIESESQIECRSEIRRASHFGSHSENESKLDIQARSNFEDLSGIERGLIVH